MQRLKSWLRNKLLKFLGIDRISERLAIVEHHFVIDFDPKTGKVNETLAQRAAREDGRPEPKPLRRSGSWDRTRRYLEDRDAAAALARTKRQN